MKLFKIFAGIMGFFAALFLISLAFPHKYKIERSIEVNLPLNQTFNYLNTIRNWPEWSPWNKSIDTSMVTFFSKVQSGKNATQYFNGNIVGLGRFRIIESDSNQMIFYSLSINQGTMQSQASFYFKAMGEKTQINWVDEGDVGYNPLYRFLLPNKKTSTGEAFEKGLAAIKTAAEKKYNSGSK